MAVLGTSCLTPAAVLASPGALHSIPGAELSIYWVISFVCMLLSIAIEPLIEIGRASCRERV